MTADILKIQKTIRKAVDSYAIVGKHDKEALVVLVSADLYLALSDEVPPPPVKPKVKKPVSVPVALSLPLSAQ